MKSFQFRLHRLLDLAEAVRQARTRELGVARASECEAAAELGRYRQQRLSHLDDLRRDATGGRLDLEAWSAGCERYRGMRREEGGAAAHLRSAQQTVAAAQGALVQARRDRDVLQRLRDRRQQAWHAEDAASEQAVLDEAAGRSGGEAGSGRA